MIAPENITELLIDWGKGDMSAFEQLLPLVEVNLKKLARHQLRRFKPGNTLQTTALINETYLQLIQQNKVQWQNRAHFFGIAAVAMRQFLLNYIRDAQCQKRGGKMVQVSLGEAMAINQPKADEILALDEALVQLSEYDARKAKVVELRYFGGLTTAEIAEVLKISEMTVTRDWNMAKAWLGAKLRQN